MTSLLVAVVLSAGPTWKEVDQVNGVRIESREVAGSKFVALKLTTTTAATPTRLCEEVFGDGHFDPEEPDLKSRRIISENEHERVTYDQISPPVVANRDYAVRAHWELLDGGACRMTFDVANELAPPLPKGWVRIEKVSGYWLFTPDGKGATALEYVVHADPAGSLPPFLVEGGRRSSALKWVKNITTRALKQKETTP